MRLPALVLLAILGPIAAACGGGSDEPTPVNLVVTANASQVPPGTDLQAALTQTADVLQGRGESYGAAGVEVSPPAGPAITVTLTGIDQATAAELLTTPGVLEFKRPQVTRNGLVACETLEGELFGAPPANVNADDVSGSLARCITLDKLGEPVWVPIEIIKDDGAQKGLDSAEVEPGSWAVSGEGGNALSVRFTDEGSRYVEQVSETLRGYPLGLFVDGQLVAAPRIQRPITNGTAQISGFQPERARLLAAILNGGALPIPVGVDSNRN